MGCSYRHISRWHVKPIAQPIVCRSMPQVVVRIVDASTAAAAIDKVIDRYPQYAGMPFAVRCLIPAKSQIH
jgi:hypothetical protein